VSAIDGFVKNNAGYAAGFSKGSLETPPSRKVAIVTCMDARIETGRLLGLEEGDAHVIRNAGGVVTEDVIRSLMISQHLLGTREIMLIHHTQCGMNVFSDDEVRDAVESETGARPPFALEASLDLDTSLRESRARLRASPFLAHEEPVRAFVYEVETGRLREV
jgi:carbonic anhydrase